MSHIHPAVSRITRQPNRHLSRSGHARIESLERRLQMSTYTVNTLSDAVTPITGQLTFRQAVADANASGGDNTIAFDPTVFVPGTSNTITLTQGQVEFNDSTGTTTVTGPGESVLSISGGGLSRVMQIDAGATVNITGLTITNGAVNASAGVIATGGGIENDGALALTDVTVSGNTAIGGSFQSGTGAQGFGGGAEGGGIFSIGPLALTQSVVSGDSAVAGNSFEYGSYTVASGTAEGGGVFCSSSLNITGGSIEQNTARGGTTAIDDLLGGGGAAEGGGIFATNTFNMSSTKMSGNSTTGGDGSSGTGDQGSGGGASGGAIYLTGDSTLSIDSFNTNTVLSGSSSPGGGVAANGYGGAIFDAGSLTIFSSSFGDNQVTGGRGASDDNGPGGNASGGAISALGPLAVTNCTLNANTATGGEGAAEAPEADGSAAGGAIYAADSLTISASTISGNTALGDSGSYDAGGGDYGGTGGSGEGGGIFSQGIATILASSVISNSATGGTGDPNYDSPAGDGGSGEGAGIFNNGSLSVINSTIAENDASGGAGGSDHYLAGNGSTGSGGGIFSTNSLMLSDCTVSGNSTVAGNGGIGEANYQVNYNGSTGSAFGAGISIFSGSADFGNTIISSNLADGNSESDVFGTAGSASAFNLIGVGGGLTNGPNGNQVGVDNPDVAPLANNGGPTLTMLPLAGSPVIDAGSNALIPDGVTTDQRGTGYPRIVDGTVDIGAVEYVAPAVGSTPPSVSLAGTGSQSAVAGQSYTFSLGSFSESSDTGPFNITIDWGDGSSATGLSMAAAGEIPRQTHTFPIAGTGTVTVSVADADGADSSSASFTVTVAAAPLTVSTTSLAASTTIATYGSLVDLTATVAGTSGVDATGMDATGMDPTGMVVFNVDGSSIKSAALENGVAVLRITTLPIGSDVVTVVYSGDSSYSASISSPVTVTIASPSSVVPKFATAKVSATTIAGQKFNAGLVVLLTNTGAALNGKLTVRYFASTSSVPGENQVLIDTVTTKSLALKTGKYARVSTLIRALPATLPAGSYYLLAAVTDPNGLTNEAATIGKVAVAAPVVKLSAVAGTVRPATLSTGKYGTISLTISNAGNISISGVLDVALFPSLNASAALTPVLALLSQRTSIAPGKSRTVRLRIKIPATLAAGTYFPVAVSTLDGRTTTATCGASFDVI